MSSAQVSVAMLLAFGLLVMADSWTWRATPGRVVQRLPLNLVIALAIGMALGRWWCDQRPEVGAIERTPTAAGPAASEASPASSTAAP